MPKPFYFSKSQKPFYLEVHISIFHDVVNQSCDLPTPSDLFTHFIPKYLQLAKDITAKYFFGEKKPFSSKLTKMCSCSAHSIVLAKKMSEGGKTKQATTLIFHMNIV